MHWLDVSLKTPTYQYFSLRLDHQTKRCQRQQCPPGLSFHDLFIMIITPLTSTPSWTQIVGSEADWNIKGEASSMLHDRQLDLHRGRYHMSVLSIIECEIFI